MTAMPETIVHVVPTLHQYHAAAAGYGFDALTGVLEALEPEVLLVELSETALQRRLPQRVKQEYQRCVFPYLEQHAIAAAPMEPGEPLFSELVGQGLEAERLFEALWPQRHAEYQRRVAGTFQRLLRSWKSPAAVDSARTDEILREQRAREDELFGPRCRDAWTRYNEHFAQAIASTAQAHPGRRMVVLVGVEHCHWLRPRLQALAAAAGGWSLAPRLGELARVAA
jgi:hypothetical protein